MPRTYENRAEPKKDAKLERLISKNLKYLSAWDMNEENIAKSDKAGEELAEYATKGATPKQIDKYFDIASSFRDPDELHDYARKIVAENTRKGRR